MVIQELATKNDDQSTPSSDISANEKMSLEAQNDISVDEKMSLPPLFTGEVDVTTLDEHGYDILLPDGTRIDAMAPPEIFDAALVTLGFNLLDRVNWPLYHRLLVLQQAPRGEHGVYLVEKMSQA